VRRPPRPAGWIGQPCATGYTATTSRGSAARRDRPHGGGAPPKLAARGEDATRAWVSQGPDIAEGGVVRWRLRDLRDRILARFSVPMDERSVGRILKTLTFSHISVRARHPQADRVVVAGRSARWSARQPDPHLGQTRQSTNCAAPLDIIGWFVQRWPLEVIFRGARSPGSGNPAAMDGQSHRARNLPVCWGCSPSSPCSAPGSIPAPA
jgi:transposase